ncbi:hypothetical protein L6452_36020 [Arctium lappa]|uniref:Uncharacterized protein n=1 Tax=Arctium lappa TaxID=4217 RepID=A0ACB8YC92_ARCLA|nr:hypothetical protein L6452_36020 [Arctium lappa]
MTEANASLIPPHIGSLQDPRNASIFYDYEVADDDSDDDDSDDDANDDTGAERLLDTVEEESDDLLVISDSEEVSEPTDDFFEFKDVEFTVDAVEPERVSTIPEPILTNPNHAKTLNASPSKQVETSKADPLSSNPPQSNQTDT